VSAQDAKILSKRELNRALLAAQLLLKQARTTLPRALERIGGIRLDVTIRRQLHEEAERLAAFHR
jgi:hypothetical protein